MNLILIRQKMRELDARRRRQALGTLAVPVVVAVFYLFCIKQFPYLRLMMHLLFVLALIWSIAGVYFLNREKSSEMPGDAGFNSGLEFCRRAVQRQCSYFPRIYLWSLGPMLMAFGAIILTNVLSGSMFSFSKATPFLLLAMVWVIAYILVGLRQQRDLRRELDELNEIERANS